MLESQGRRGEHERRSASCWALTTFVSGVEKNVSGMVETSRKGSTMAAAAGTDTCEWMSIVVVRGLVSRPGRLCFRAAVGP